MILYLASMRQIYDKLESIASETRDADRKPYEPYVRYRHMGAVYRTGGHLVTTVTGMRPVDNRILPYFDGRLRPSYGSF
jgi:hypothetical protein